MTASADLDRLQRRLGYRFRDAELLALALTHRSAGAANNERLEFLGDGLINFVAAEALYRARPGAEEGDLSRLRASLVCEGSLARLAEGLDLGAALQLGGGALKSGGFRRAPILADTLEAVLGAVYVDGGFDAGRAACEQLLGASLAQLPDPDTLKDAKTRLQEYLQGLGRPLPVYELLQAEGPEHRPSFTVSCRLADAGDATEGQASNRRSAEQLAAERMLQRLGANHA
ncbi:MAG: ribonuclease III [Nevskiaceae bacterium]